MYSDDIKQLALKLYLKFYSLRAVSKLIDCSHSTVGLGVIKLYTNLLF